MTVACLHSFYAYRCVCLPGTMKTYLLVLLFALASTASAQRAEQPSKRQVYEAIKNGDADSCKMWCHEGLPIAEMDLGRTRHPIHWAARLNQLEIVKIFINDCNDSVDRISNNETPLYRAYGSYEVAKFLIDAGADVNHAKVVSVPKMTIRTPIFVHHVNNKASVKIIQLLIENDVDLTAQTNDGFSVLMMAVNRGRKDVIELFLKAEEERGAEIGRHLTTNGGQTAGDFAKDEEMRAWLNGRGIY